MANTFTTVDWVTMEGLRLLVNKLVVGQFFNTDYNSQFNKAYAVGDTVRVELPQRFTVSTGLAYQPQNLGQNVTTVTVDRVRGVHFEWDSVERVLQMPRGEERVRDKILKPAMAQLAQQIDSECAEWAYLNTNNIVGTLATDPTTFDATSAAARQRLIELACPPDMDKGMIVSPSVMRSIKNTAITYFNPASAISKQYKEGSIGRADGFDWYESMSLKTHTAGTWAGAVTVNAASQAGSTLTVACTTGDTFLVGDVFCIGSTTTAVNEVNPMTRETTTTAQAKQFVITTASTGAASVATLTFQPAIVGPGGVYQNVSQLPPNGAALTLFPGTTSPNGKSGKNGLALHRDAFALVGVKLENPKQGSVEIVSEQRDPETGISISFVRAFDPIQRKMVNRFDTLFGFGNLYPANCAVRILGA